MSACPQLPQPGDRVSAGLTREIIRYERENAPVQGPGVSLARGPNGTTISLSGETKPKRPPHFPFEVAGSSESHYKFAVFVPEGAVTIGGTVITPTGITAITGELDVSGWYKLDDEDQVTNEEAMLYLIAYDNQTAKFSFDIDGAGATSGSASAPSIVSVLPIAVLSVQEIGEQSSVGVVHRQLARHPFTVDVGEGSDDDDGKLIESTSVETSSDPGGQNKIVFNYTDGSSDTFIVMNGLKGPGGNPGMDGDTPEIEVMKNGNITYIYVDGELVAQITDGSTPKITASKMGKITTIYADGVPIATINDGEDGGGGGEQTDMEVITGVTFSMSEDTGKLTAKLTRKKIKAVVVETLEPEEVEVATVKQVPVVTSEAYSTSSHQFTNERRLVTVLGDAAAQGQTPFTATPLSSE